MTGIVDWAASRARMVLAFIALSLLAGGLAYSGLPKEGEPDIEIPALFVSVQFPGISAEDSETLLVQVMETELADLDGLKTMTGTAAEGYAGVALEFEFGWDKTQIMADVRDSMNKAQGSFPSGAETYSITEINFSEFPIIIVNLTGALPERTLRQLAEDLQDRLESLEPVLEAGIAGSRQEMLEVIIDPLALEAYNVTAGELINVVVNNNLLVAAGEIESEQGTFSVKIPSSFDSPQDVYDLPVKTNGDRVITLGDLATIQLTFEDRAGTARFNGENTVALQVVKRKGFNLIDTAALVRETVAAAEAEWPPELREAIVVGTSNDQSRVVDSMVGQLEGSVLTAIALVMIVVLAALGPRPALLVGFAIPTSFLLCFVLLGVMGITISNIVMFGLILAVGMLVDGAIVVVEYADKRIREGSGPMSAYTEAAKRMFWPIVSSTATTLCAFLPMLFWPGVPGEFMGMLPVTLIFVLSASLIVALIYLPVLGGVTGRLSRWMTAQSERLKDTVPWAIMALAVPILLLFAYFAALQTLNPNYFAEGAPRLLGILALIGFAFAISILFGALRIERAERRVKSGYRRSIFGHFIHAITGNPVVPVLVVAGVFGFVMFTFSYFGENNNGVEFFVESEPEQATVYVRARGNLSLAEKDAMVRQVEEIVLAHPGVSTVFSFAGDGGLNTDASGASVPPDTIGQVQFETIAWEDRPTTTETIYLLGFIPFERQLQDIAFDGDTIIDDLNREFEDLYGFEAEILALARGPAAGKPVHLRLTSDDPEPLEEATLLARAQFEDMPGLTLIEDSLPQPGIDWEIRVDVEKAGRYGADVATVGAMVQLVTRGILLDTMRVPTSDEEIEIRVRLPESDRVLSTLDNLRVRTPNGLVPLSNFITREAVPQLAQIDRVDQRRYFDVKAGIEDGWEIIRLRVPAEAVEGTPFEAMAEALEAEARAEAEANGEDYQGAEAFDFDIGYGVEVSYDEWIAGADADFGLVDAEASPELIAALLANDPLTEELIDGTAPPALYSSRGPPLDRALIAAGFELMEDGAEFVTVPMTANERIERITTWLDTSPLPAGVDWEWTGDQEEQEESGQFLMTAFAGALGLMFIILLAQFNSFYNAVLVLIAVVLSTTGVLWGMILMDQTFSIIMTGTGIVALAGIVVNNNIVLIDTYQEYAKYMPRTEAITRTAEARIRPVLLTTITTMAGLAPMMFGLSLNFIDGGYSIDSPTALWWKQLATAVVFGLGIATVLTLVLTPALLALRVWFGASIMFGANNVMRLLLGAGSQIARDRRTEKAVAHTKGAELVFDDWTTPPLRLPDNRPWVNPMFAESAKAARPLALTKEDTGPDAQETWVNPMLGRAAKSSDAPEGDGPKWDNPMLRRKGKESPEADHPLGDEIEAIAEEVNIVEGEIAEEEVNLADLRRILDRRRRSEDGEDRDDDLPEDPIRAAE